MLYILQYIFKCLLKSDFAVYLKVCTQRSGIGGVGLLSQQFRSENCRDETGRAQVLRGAVWLNSDGETLKDGNGLIFNLPHLEFLPEYNF